MASLVVVTPIDPTHQIKLNDNNEATVVDEDKCNDDLDRFNHPRLRRALILSELLRRQHNDGVVVDPACTYAVPDRVIDINRWRDIYSPVHTSGLLDFLTSGWSRWSSNEQGEDDGNKRPLISSNAPLLRDISGQRVSKSALGQMSYYCTDIDTPVFEELLSELRMDGTLIESAINIASIETTVYAMVTHPGHHAAADSFGGYCYVNHVAAMAKLVGATNKGMKVAILDVDYHVGNGTASIFYEDPSVLVVSIHCDPDHDYPFHSGFADQTGSREGVGTTLHLPLPPRTDWGTYSMALKQGLEAIQSFGTQFLLVSLGLDTYDQDPVCVRRAGFGLQGDDFVAMGTMIAEMTPQNAPVIFLQEGGYRMDKVASAAADVVTTFCHKRRQAMNS